MRYIYKYLIATVLRMALFPFRLLRINKRLIVFDAYNGKSIACNPYYIYAYLKDAHQDLKLVWVVKDKTLIKGNNVEYVILNSLRYYYLLLTAKVYVRNVLMPVHIPFRDSQIRIDTWHGGGAYKGTMYSVNQMPLRAKTNHMIASNTTWKIASCRKFIEYAHKDQFLEIDKFLKTGTPRCDLFFNKSAIREKSEHIRHYFGISNSAFVILYAPTYRSKAYKPSFDLTLDFSKLIDCVQERFNTNEVLLLFRGHHTFKNLGNLNYINETNERMHIIDTSGYQDTQAILCASDLLISDYSSIIWDFSFMYRPCFLFVPDLEEYLSDYEMATSTPIDKWGFPIAKSNEELREVVLKFDNDSYVKAIKKHHSDVGSYEDGFATKRICTLILNEIRSA